MLEKVRSRVVRRDTPITAVLVCLLLVPGPSRAQSRVDVSLPEILVLHYYPEIDLTLRAEDLVRKSFRNAGVPAVDQGDAAGLGVAPDLAMGSVAGDLLGPQSPTAMRFGRGYFGDIWAVRAVSPGGQTRVRVSVDRAIGSHAAGGSLEMTDAIVLVNGGPRGRDVVFNSPGLATPRVGSLRVTVDLAGATHAGWYRGIRLVMRVEHL